MERLNLREQVRERPIVHHNIVGPRLPLCSGGLGLDDGLHLSFAILIPGHGALELERLRGVDQEDPIHQRCLPCFEKQGRDENRVRRRGGGQARAQRFPNARMEQGLKPVPLCLIRKDACSKGCPVKRAVGLKDFPSEVLRNGGQRRLPGLDHLAGGEVRVYYRNAESFKVI
jgi:hypothetical protein